MRLCAGLFYDWCLAVQVRVRLEDGKLTPNNRFFKTIKEVINAPTRLGHIGIMVEKWRVMMKDHSDKKHVPSTKLDRKLNVILILKSCR